MLISNFQRNKDMKAWSWMLFFVLNILVSCDKKVKTSWEIRVEQERQKGDSLKNTDVKLSFMGIEVGGSIDKIEEAIKKEKVSIDSCGNGIYYGKVSFPCIHDTTTYYIGGFMRIRTVNNRVASIDLYFSDINVYDFFIDTFNERYYDTGVYHWREPDPYRDIYCYIWSFKEQNVKVDRETHKEIRKKNFIERTEKNNWEEVDVAHGTSVTYSHKELLKEFYEQTKKIANREENLKDSLKKVKIKDSLEKVRIKENKIEKIKNNI